MFDVTKSLVKDDWVALNRATEGTAITCIRKEIDSLEESIQRNTNTPESTAQSLRCVRSIL